MANAPKKIDAAPVDDTPADDFAQWVADARRKATAGPAALGHGSVRDADPKLHYAVLDGDTPKASLDRQRELHVSLGYREMPGMSVVGYRNPIVMAIPQEIYREVIRRGRVADIGQAMKKWGGIAFVAPRPAELS